MTPPKVNYAGFLELTITAIILTLSVVFYEASWLDSDFFPRGKSDLKAASWDNYIKSKTQKREAIKI
ncbi:MAG: hypothetical protein QNJ72_02465 [Pleurocapsa sp. MO_226.B13]|nr:hypothetical protein [Pleurocapsa sp. MO_226.B13]